MAVSLLPLEEVKYIDDFEVQGLPEGARTRVEVNRYERSHLNRQACIAFHGACCLVCGFDFEENYGLLGRGAIVVHHVVPVSQLGEGYVIDPVKDLVPVCPNCHMMLHRQNPPFSMEELKSHLRHNTES